MSLKMHGLTRILIFVACILLQLQFSYAEETEDEEEVVLERQCVGADISPADESSEGIFNVFATGLESYTGLGNTPLTVTLNCEQTSCVVNPNGTAIWEARMDFYMNNMMSENENARNTLDGCLCFSEDSAAFQTCMQQVRINMVLQLDSVLMTKFRQIVEGNCTLYAENCLSTVG